MSGLEQLAIASASERGDSDICTLRVIGIAGFVYCDACHQILNETNGRKHVEGKGHQKNVPRYIAAKERAYREKEDRKAHVRELRREQDLQRRRDIAAKAWLQEQKDRERLLGGYWPSGSEDDLDGEPGTAARKKRRLSFSDSD